MIKEQATSCFYPKIPKRIIFKACHVLSILALLLTISCDKINIFSRPYVATVNGAKIYLDEYQIRLNQKMSILSKDVLLNKPNYVMRLEEEVLDGMITEKIMFLRAQELNISVGASELEDKIKEIKNDYGEDFISLLAQENIKFDQWKEELKKEMLLQKLVAVDVNGKINISDDEAEDYYNEHRNNYRLEARVHVQQIVLRDFDKAQEVLMRLKTGEDFAKLAAKFSIGPEARQGGDLGYITRDIMPEPLEEAIFKLPINKISPVIQSSYGFHIFKILDSQPAKIRNFSDVKAEVIADIRALREEAAFTNWLNSLKLKAVIKKENNIMRKKINRQK
jgi:parvulin-like peptidyl-prolyl isomerase